MTPLQGSTYVYNSFLEPWCSKNEADIDAAMASAQTSAIAFGRTRIAALVDLVLNKSPQSHPDADTDADKPAHPLAVPLDQLKGIWTAYGPSFLAAFAPKDATDVSSTANDVLHSAN